jgi:integrase
MARRVLDFAKARGWRSGENPAAWRGHLALILPKRQRLSRGHHAAMPYRDLPNFIGQLREHRSVSVAAVALEFAILTAARTGEVLGSRWSEFDLENKSWTVSAARMKFGRTPCAALKPGRADRRELCGGQDERVRMTGNAVELSYRRSDALEKRRALTEAWSLYCGPPPGGNVVPIRTAL